MSCDFLVWVITLTPFLRHNVKYGVVIFLFSHCVIVSNFKQSKYYASCRYTYTHAYGLGMGYLTQRNNPTDQQWHCYEPNKISHKLLLLQSLCVLSCASNRSQKTLLEQSPLYSCAKSQGSKGDGRRERKSMRESERDVRKREIIIILLCFV